MSRGQTMFLLALVALGWVGFYFSARSVRPPPLGQFGDSPFFQPKSRRTAAVSATVFAAFVAFLHFAIGP